ncbi:TerB family tellurite resistance protein [Govanella unica]|uniref:TerB family tellurite resistance protein n=1 Tax=Govanella unica TaxID=2975056 RepID=A0A9X3TZX9_9PROT|nr:TerB family tellurite resistance protein [Govania unica]MDA5195065.1 TerB family tellurite resistance protein [Govania unica]
MSIWGKLLGGAAGFAFGGPLGAFLGALAGHVADTVADTVTAHAPADPTTSITFTIGVIVLSAKMARADGQVTAEEVALFRRLFQVPPQEARNVTRIFDLAREDVAGFEIYARQIAGLLRDRPAVLEDLLDSLFLIALADGHMHEAELAYLISVSRIFGFSDADFARIRAAHMGPDHSDPYAILGLLPTVSNAELKLAYRRLVKEHHPDHLIAQGMPAEFVRVATHKLAAINAAYDSILSARGRP